MHITESERKVLRSIYTNDFGTNGDCVWADSINDSAEPSGIEGRSLSGVVSSLMQKGLLHSGGYGRDATIGLTDAGRAAAQ